MNTTSIATADVQFVSFYIGDSLYGLDIRLVKEVNTNTDITRIPLSKPHIRGLVNIRGQIVLVIDSSVLFSGQPHTISADSNLVILKTAADIDQMAIEDPADKQKLPDKPVALLVDRIGNVITVPKTIIEKTPQHMNAERARFIKCVVKTDSFFLIVLDPLQIIAGTTIQTEQTDSQTI